MGKVIICTGNRANKPYCIVSDGICVYTIEELCYYIYHNIESIDTSFFHNELTIFIKEELGLLERAEFIEGLIRKNAGLKDLVVSILCSADIYTEKEIKDLLLQIDLFYRLKPIQRRKRKVDTLMRQEHYKEALTEYRAILNSREFAELTPVECGDVLHNIAVIEARAGAFDVASLRFLEAFERNRKKESFKQYLYALKLSGQDLVFEKELTNKTLYDEIEAELIYLDETIKSTEIYVKFLKLKQLKELQNNSEYNLLLEQILSELKQKYRKESI